MIHLFRHGSSLAPAMRALTSLVAALTLLSACAAQPPAIPPTLTPFPTVATSAPAATLTPEPLSPVPEPAPAANPVLQVKLEAIAAEVSAIRGLSPINPPRPKFLSQAEIERRSQEEIGSASNQKEVQEFQDLLQLLGLLKPDDDLAKMLAGLRGGAVLGFFDTRSGELVVVGDPEKFNGLAEMTYAHEYTHALQHAAYNLEAMEKARENDSEASAALTALIEGDAVLTMSIYIFQHYSQAEVQRFTTDPRPDRSEYPVFLTEGLFFPYREGVSFVSRLYSSGNFRAVDKAFADPPVSTQQIMHPELYAKGKKPVPVALPDIAQALGPGWALQRTDSFGEFDLRSMLLTHLPLPEASQGASGWAGDRLALLKNTVGKRMLVSLVEWDSEQEARGFFETYGRWLRVRGESLQQTSSALDWASGGLTSTLRTTGKQTLLVIGPDGEAVTRARGLFPALP